jgi:glutathione S-transferase
MPAPPSPRPYRLFGVELSPYSVKVRSYLRYKRIPHQWVIRSSAAMPEFQQHARLPLIPLLLTPEGEALQDSTPILEWLEARHPEPPIHPADPALAFVSALLEEYADEWGNKPMFHYRWWYEADRRSASERIARLDLPDAPPEALARVAAAITERMVPRLRFVGSSAETRPLIEASFERQLAILEPHLARRRYVLGARPALADFGLAAQLYQLASDPTPGERIRVCAPLVADWIERMLDPRREGDFESWEALAPTLEPLLAEEVAGCFLPWSDANARALAAGEASFRVALAGGAFAQQPQKYHARSLAALRARYAAVPDRSRLDPILERTGCRRWLAAA